MNPKVWPYVEYDEPEPPKEAGFIHKVALASGFREWDDVRAIEDVLEFVRPTLLIHGAAAGADFIADRWAKKSGIVVEPYKIPQDWWNIYGKRAGPIRNGKMVDRALKWEAAGHMVMVLVFPAPESTGTIDLIDQAIRANLPVLRYV